MPIEHSRLCCIKHNLVGVYFKYVIFKKGGIIVLRTLDYLLDSSLGIVLVSYSVWDKIVTMQSPLDRGRQG